MLGGFKGKAAVKIEVDRPWGCILQLGISIPERSSQESHHFVKMSRKQAS